MDITWDEFEVEMNKFHNEEKTKMRLSICEFNKRGIQDVGAT
jgi:hypothetical protein